MDVQDFIPWDSKLKVVKNPNVDESKLGVSGTTMDLVSKAESQLLDIAVQTEMAKRAQEDRLEQLRNEIHMLSGPCMSVLRAAGDTPYYVVIDGEECPAFPNSSYSVVSHSDGKIDLGRWHAGIVVSKIAIGPIGKAKFGWLPLLVCIIAICAIIFPMWYLYGGGSAITSFVMAAPVTKLIWEMWSDYHPIVKNISDEETLVKIKNTLTDSIRKQLG